MTEKTIPAIIKISSLKQGDCFFEPGGGVYIVLNASPPYGKDDRWTACKIANMEQTNLKGVGSSHKINGEAEFAVVGNKGVLETLLWLRDTDQTIFKVDPSLRKK